MKQKVRLTGKQRLEIAVGVLQDFIDREATSNRQANEFDKIANFLDNDMIYIDDIELMVEI